MFKRRRLLIATMVYWFLLVYIIAALVWWFIALQQQNHQMTSFKISQLKLDDPGYAAKSSQIFYEQQLKTTRNIGEGTTFLLLILVGAIFVYLPVRRQINLQHQQQNFMMAVTHELKTPIAVAKLNMETLMKYPLDEAKKQKILGSALHEINRLDGLANNILVSAQLDSGRYLSGREQLDMSALTTGVVQDFRQRFPDRNWSSQIDPDLVVPGDMLLLQMLLNNLIENALKYSPKQGLISVDLASEDNHVTLRVKDQGPGVPLGERKSIFQKFYRIGNELTRTTQGTGLGLYLSKKIVSDHKAHIEVMDNLPVGSIFTVKF